MKYLVFLRAEFSIEVWVHISEVNDWIEIWIPDNFEKEVSEFFDFDLSTKTVSDEEYALFILTFL